MYSTATFITVASLALLRGAMAGPGAVVYACLNLPNPAPTSFTANFTAGASADTCLNNVGMNTQIDIPKTFHGITCQSAGYVEGKASCIGEWSLSYDANSYSGYTSTNWGVSQLNEDGTGGGGNQMELENATPGVQVCNSPSDCGGDRVVNWPGGTQGPLYIIFTPVALA